MERIKLINASKRFVLKKKIQESALSKINSIFHPENKKVVFNVLKDISFSVKDGEVLGIIGRNGSGKSTLLRVIAGIYQVDSGKVETNGKSVYLSGFDIGLNEKLTMRENIYFIGSLLGLSSKEVKSKFNSIVEFSELRDFVDVKLSQFSTGMISRLAFTSVLFSVSHSKPDILLLDEVFSTGTDDRFQKKALKKMEELIKIGSSVVLVSHELETIKNYCDKVCLIDKGSIICLTDPESAIKKYLSIKSNSLIS